MADGDLKRIEDWLGLMTTGLTDECKKVAEKVIDERANKFFETLKDEVPVEHGDLRDSITKEKMKSNPRNKTSEWYGYKVFFKGYKDVNGKRVAFQKIANSLNYGTLQRLTSDLKYRGEISNPRHFVEYSKRELVGIDKEIYNKTLNMLNEKAKV